MNHGPKVSSHREVHLGKILIALSYSNNISEARKKYQTGSIDCLIILEIQKTRKVPK